MNYRLLLGMMFFFLLPPLALAEDWGNQYISYTREVANQLPLADFQLGSQESIRDQDGHGAGYGILMKNEGHSFWTLEFGRSTTRYQGRIEDGVNFSFAPQAGAGFDSLSSSNNIIYDVDLEFENPYISLSYTNWKITKTLGRQGFYPSTYGLGIIQQKARGLVTIRGVDETEIATATYKSAQQKFYHLGWAFNFEFLYFSLLLRNVSSPELVILSCNEAAVGKTACQRIEAATGNRNAAPRIFTGGLFQAGILF